METVEVLMVEDNRGDVVLVQEAVTKAGLPHHITVVGDGEEALAYLRREGRYASAVRPELIIMDLNLPRKGGREVLDVILPDPAMRDIPLVLLSSSRSELELVKTYKLPARSCLVKPSTFAGYVDLVRAIEAYRQAAPRRV